MCGIIACLCVNQASCAQILFTGLKYMQNRGYDSAGLFSVGTTVTESGEKPVSSTITTKYASTESKTALECLENTLTLHTTSKVGFGHTRWATHGAKTDMNSHPHTSSDELFTIVHNGIIENYKELQKMLLDEGYSFKSETDTEIVCNLLSYVYKQHCQEESDNNISVVNQITHIIGKTQELMSGSWGLVIHYRYLPETLFCVRHGSPLLIGKTDREIIVASEQSGFGNRLNTYFILKSNDVCVLNYDSSENELSIRTSHTYTMKQANKQLIRDSPAPYPHWTIREIHEQAVSAKNAISMGGRVLDRTSVRLGGLHEYIETFKKVDNIILLGCGTSYHSGMIAMQHFKTLCELNCVILFDGAEFTENDIPKLGTTIAIFISQSGETKDLHRCISIAKQKNVFTVGVVNVVDSLIAREVNCGVYLNAGTEVAVASTKSFTSQTVVLTMIAIWIAQQKGIQPVLREEYIADIHNLSFDIEKTLETATELIDDTVLDIFTDKPSCFLLGKGTGEATAKEGALKIKEVAYVHTEGYSSSALKHGPFALLTEGFPVILFAPNDDHFFKNQNAYQEVLSRGASIIVLHNKLEESDEEDETTTLRKIFAHSIKQICVPKNKTFQSVLNIIPIQILAYKLAVKKGINPDIPKNLAKVVTVE